MGSNTFLICAIALACLAFQTSSLSVGERNESPDFEDTAAEVKEGEESKPPRPAFPLFTLPSLSSLSLPSLNLPQLPSLQALNIPNPFQQPIQVVKATKTEYVEVTRRQTVHPVCYTAYQIKAPCLPFNQKENEDGNEENFELNTVNHVHESLDIEIEDADRENEQTIRPTAALRMIPATETFTPFQAGNDLDGSRGARYLQFRDRKDTLKDIQKEEIKLESSESFSPVVRPTGIRNPFQRQTTEYVTKTVLITKLEKFTDHRVTATMVAHNCLPVDPSIQRCRGHKINPIFDAPVHQIDPLEIEPFRNDEKADKQGIIIASVVQPRPGVSVHDHNRQILAAVQAVKQASQSLQSQTISRSPPKPQAISPLISESLGIQPEDNVENKKEDNEKVGDENAKNENIPQTEDVQTEEVKEKSTEKETESSEA